MKGMHAMPLICLIFVKERLTIVTAPQHGRMGGK